MNKYGETRKTSPTRKAPGNSAGLYPEGTTKIGINGNTWIVQINSNGAKRWKELTTSQYSDFLQKTWGTYRNNTPANPIRRTSAKKRSVKKRHSKKRSIKRRSKKRSVKRRSKKRSVKRRSKKHSVKRR